MNEPMSQFVADLTSFIAKLRGKTPSNAALTELPEHPAERARRVSPSANLIEYFADAAVKINTQVYVTDAAHWPDVLLDMLVKNSIKSLLIAPLDAKLLPDELAADLHGRLMERGIEICEQPDDDALFRVEAALTGVTAAIAEFGSLVCTSSDREARGFSLIPPMHIALVPASRIRADLCDLFIGAGAKEPPAGVSLVTGPSKTADIEGVLVNGVHGPKSVHAICIRDA